MAEPQTPQAPEAFQAEISTLRNAPFAAGESQLDRTAKIEAAYQKQYPEPRAQASEGDGGAAAQQQAVNWGDAEGTEVSESDATLRTEMGAFFTQRGYTAEQQTSVLAVARRIFAGKELTEEQGHDKEIATERALRKAWGKAYDDKLAAAYEVADEIERMFPHGDLQRAIENGLWIDADVLMALAQPGGAQPPTTGDLKAITKKLATVNQGSPEWYALTKEQEAGYKKRYGTGR